MAIIVPELDSLAGEFTDYGLTLTSAQLAQVRTYLALLLRWNRRLNLTALRQPQAIVRQLFAESIYLTRLGSFQGRLLDVGTGAGFPGLALKLALPALDVTLLEASRRKCTFLKEVLRSLQLPHVTVVADRFEAWAAAQAKQTFDVVTTRALALTPKFLALVETLLRERAMLALYTTVSAAAAISESVTAFTWSAPALLPHTRARAILVGTKMAKCST